ncbi:MAG: putative methionine sulfoxide reductase [Candidatus Xenobia bacterium]|jgi:peptide-methionine (R)-S-oxide reductase
MKQTIAFLALTVALVGATMAEPRFPVQKTDAEWKKQLTPEQYRILRGKGTEMSCQTNPMILSKEPGQFLCVGCGQVLFETKAKFQSGTGWPSFYQPFKPGSVVNVTDTSHGMVRVEVLCSRCGGHLGHVFEDGPPPTGLRYCINSVCLKFVPAKKP